MSERDRRGQKREHLWSRLLRCSPIRARCRRYRRWRRNGPRGQSARRWSRWCGPRTGRSGMGHRWSEGRWTCWTAAIRSVNHLPGEGGLVTSMAELSSRRGDPPRRRSVGLWRPLTAAWADHGSWLALEPRSYLTKNMISISTLARATLRILPNTSAIVVYERGTRDPISIRGSRAASGPSRGSAPSHWVSVM